MIRSLIISLFLLIPASIRAQQPSSRSMDDLNWKEFQQLVPAKIKTVILTVGTLEAHGFINNGADNTVPVAIANAISGRRLVGNAISFHDPALYRGSEITERSNSSESRRVFPESDR